MLFGLLRMCLTGVSASGAFGLGYILWKQCGGGSFRRFGLIWLLLATIVELPPAVFIPSSSTTQTP
ncbi:hypothetical protein BJV77DRAFT_1068247 [Russula vinacea]|nr:hypothetical protein BJV77DRAFT_1068247 [Russula vinacea]